MFKLLLTILASFAPLAVTARANEHPAEFWEIGVETGFLTNVGHNTPLDYDIIPTQLVFHSPTFLRFYEGAAGDALVVRHRSALIAEGFVQGAEDFYLGVSLAPSLEYWFADKKTAVFAAVGGGVGYTNAGDVVGGLGQAFTLNWFAQLGLRHQISEKWSLSGGGFFTHHSNGGMTDPNPGIDALGGFVGLTVRF
jgi:lipid A 3-O-deacylase